MDIENITSYVLGYSAGASGGGGGGSNAAVSVTGTAQNAVWEISWGDLVIPDNITIADGLFYGSPLSEVPRIAFNDNVTSAQFTFANCSKLTNADLTKFNFTNITQLTKMFQSSTKLNSVTIANDAHSTQQLTCTMMFDGCTGLTTINLNNLVVDKAAGLNYMFQNCTNLTSVELKNFTSYLSCSITGMFKGCTSLQHIDMRNIDFYNVSSQYAMAFQNVPNNCEIIVKDTYAKNFLASKFSNLTNVKTVEEYENE